MKIIDVAQGTDAWLQCRTGIPTASQADRLLSPKKLQLSASAGLYRNQLLTEWLLGRPVDWSGQSGWMDRGIELEAEARRFYELQRDVEVAEVGFLLRDDGQFGGSPDGLIGDDGVLEIKSPALHTHIGYMLAPDEFAEKYRGQVQSLLYISGRAYADLFSYNPELPPVIQRIEPDADYHAALDRVLAQFTAWLDEGREKLAKHRTVEAVHA